MRFIVNSQLLLENLQSVSGLLVENKALPILEKCLFRVSGNTLTLVASDSESIAVVDIALEEVSGEGSVAVPARSLLDTLKTMPDIPLIFNVDESTSGIEISGGTGQYKLTGESADTYPEIPQMGGDTALASISSDILVRAISKTVFATGNDQLRATMCGVLFEMKPDGMTFVATDAHKLVRYRRSDVKTPAETSFVVPKKALMLLKGILSMHKEAVEVRLEANEKNVFFQFENVHISCRLVDGRYPNYQAVIPTENPNKLTVARQSFLTCVKRICIFASKAMPQARLSMSGGNEVLVSAEDVENSNAAKERISCMYEGDPMEIGFNARYFLEMLANLESEDVCLQMSMPNRAGLIVPVGEGDANEDILMLVMPVML